MKRIWADRLSSQSLLDSFSPRIPPVTLHLCLHRPPQRLDVPLAETRGPPPLDQLQEEGVLREDGLGEHLEEVSGYQTGIDSEGEENRGFLSSLSKNIYHDTSRHERSQVGSKS